MEAQISKMPPAQQAAIRKAMAAYMPKARKDTPPPKVKIENTDQKSVVAGYPVNLKKVFVNGKLAYELWVSPKIILGKDLDMKKFGKMMSAFKGLAGEREAAAWSPSVIDLLEKGWSLKFASFAPGDKKIENYVEKVTNEKIDTKLFSVPADYKKMNLDDVFKK